MSEAAGQGTLTVVGVVTQIAEEVKKTKDGTRTFKVYNLFVDGKKYGLGYKKDLVTSAGVETGDTVRVTLAKSGDFWNVDSLEKVAPVPQVQASPAAVPPFAASVSGVLSSRQPGSTVQVQIVRQTALKLATDLVVPFATDARRKGVLSLDQQIGKIVAFADHYVRYVETGKVEVLNTFDVSKLKEEGVPVEE